MTNKKTFALRDVLTVTTGRLLTERKNDNDNGISGLYDILGHMSGVTQSTLSLSHYATKCKPELLALFPELSEAELALPKLDSMIAQEGTKDRPAICVDLWLATVLKVTNLKAEYSIGKLL